MSTSTVNTATREVHAGVEPSERQRRPGAGVKPAVEVQPRWLEALDELVHPETRGHAGVAAVVDAEVDVRVGPRAHRPGVSGVSRVGANGPKS